MSLYSIRTIVFKSLYIRMHIENVYTVSDVWNVIVCNIKNGLGFEAKWKLYRHISLETRAYYTYNIGIVFTKWRKFKQMICDRQNLMINAVWRWIFNEHHVLSARKAFSFNTFRTTRIFFTSKTSMKNCAKMRLVLWKELNAAFYEWELSGFTYRISYSICYILPYVVTVTRIDYSNRK